MPLAEAPGNSKECSTVVVLTTTSSFLAAGGGNETLFLR